MDRFLLFRNDRLRATRDLFRAATSEFKSDASPICVSVRAPRAGGFLVILSHLPQIPTAALLSHAGVDGESVRSWPCKKMTNWAVPPEPACLEQRDETELLIGLSLCLVAVCHTSSLVKQALLNFRLSQVSCHGEV